MFLSCLIVSRHREKLPLVALFPPIELKFFLASLPKLLIPDNFPVKQKNYNHSNLFLNCYKHKKGKIKHNFNAKETKINKQTKLN